MTTIKFQLKNLPFESEAFEPKLSAESFSFHYGKHHQTYVDNLNKLCDQDMITRYSLSIEGDLEEELFKIIKHSNMLMNQQCESITNFNINEKIGPKTALQSDAQPFLDKKIFNNAAQHWNHEFFWNSINPSKQDVSSDLIAMIEQQWGSLESFNKQFYDYGAQLFGSGWVWLIFDKTTEKLQIMQTLNAQTPLVTNTLVPLLVIDAWEHAYYIDYRNKRVDYLETIIPHLNWQFAQENFAKIK